MLELRGVTAGYGGHIVLRDVDLVVPDNSVVALLGPNGAGKTTLLRVACGMVAPSGGQVLLDGENVGGWPPDRLARLGVCHVPEGRGVFPSLSVRDNLRLQSPVDLNDEIMQRVAAAFPVLNNRLDQAAGTMSGGEQQMLALAHAYAAQPSLVLVDEVSMGLAPVVVDEIFTHLKTLAAGDTALLIVEQYVARALDLADYAYVLRKGRIEFAGEPGELTEADIMASYLGSA
jgi:branched-chain amino acid transport system ATP-binding protein